jgi:hypothetical protein
MVEGEETGWLVVIEKKGLYQAAEDCAWDELHRKIQRSGQFPDEFEKIEDTQSHYVAFRTW